MDLFTTISFTVSAFSDVSEIVPLVFWLIFAWKKKEYKILGLFLCLSVVLKLITLVTAKLHIHNMPVYHLLALVEVVMVYSFYSQLIFNRVEILGAVVLLSFNLVNSIFIQDISQFNSIAWSVNMLVLLVVGISYLFKLYNDETDQSLLEERPAFIITTGWLIYAAGSLFTYLLGTSILSGKAAGFFHNAWIFQCVSNILKNTLISYGLWRVKRF